MAAEWRPCGGSLVAPRQPLAVFFFLAELERNWKRFSKMKREHLREMQGSNGAALGGCDGGWRWRHKAALALLKIVREKVRERDSWRLG